MQIKQAMIAVAALAAVGVAAPASAHHSFPATYHVDQTTSISGTVVQFLFRNPHSFVHVMAPDKDGKMQRWAVEWGGGAALASQNVTSTSLKAGDKVTISGNPGRNPADHRIRMQKIVRPADGWQWGGNFD
jgi:cell shape-determining protein MreC